MLWTVLILLLWCVGSFGWFFSNMVNRRSNDKDPPYVLVLALPVLGILFLIELFKGRHPR